MKLRNINFLLRCVLLNYEPRNTTLLSEEMQNVLFIVSLSTAASSHRKPASASTSHDNCRVQGHRKTYFHITWLKSLKSIIC